MMQEDEKKQPAANDTQQKEHEASTKTGDGQRDNKEHSYPGKLDQVEGKMHNGEIGGGIAKEESK